MTERELTKKQIQSLLADVFASHTLNNGLEFEIEGKYKVNYTFTVEDEYLRIHEGSVHKVISREKN